MFNDTFINTFNLFFNCEHVVVYLKPQCTAFFNNGCTVFIFLKHIGIIFHTSAQPVKFQ